MRCYNYRPEKKAKSEKKKMKISLEALQWLNNRGHHNAVNDIMDHLEVNDRFFEPVKNPQWILVRRK